MKITTAGGFWDQLCATNVTPVDPPAVIPPQCAPNVIPSPMPNPSPLPIDSEPAPAPGNDNITDALKCLVDASSSFVTDEVTCVAQK